MEFCVQWVTTDPEKEFWDQFDENPTLPKEMLVQYFRSPEEKPEGISVYYALLCSGEERAAGCIFIYFPQSSSILIRHIFIKDAFRKEFDLDGIDPSYEELTPLFSKKPSEGTARCGLSHLLSEIRKWEGDSKKRIFVFGETINVLMVPEMDRDEHRRINKLHRFYAAIKGKTFETALYDRPRINNEFNGLPLSLINFPDFHGQPFAIPIPVVMSFVEEYRAFVKTYGAAQKLIKNWLDWPLLESIISSPAVPAKESLSALELGDEYLADFLLSLIDEKYVKDQPFIYMRELPRFEEPKIAFKRASVCFELMVDEDYYNPKNINPEQKFFKIREEEEEQSFTQRYFPWLAAAPEQKPEVDEKQEEAAGLTREQKTNKILTDGYCIVHHSFETDLLAYRHQSNPPFFTKNYKPKQTITISFPRCNDFISEGRKERFYAKTEGDADYLNVSMHCFVNYSYFMNSRMRVWHIVLTASEDLPVSEFDIIKLMKFFSGSQESTSEVKKKKDELSKVKFSVGTDDQKLEMLEFLDFFREVSGVTYEKREEVGGNRNIDSELSLMKNIKTGIVQLDSNYIGTDTLITHLENSAPLREDKPDAEPNNGKIDGEKIEAELRKYHGDVYETITKKSRKEGQVNPYQSIDYILKTYCGIALGLFDFERMGWQEVNDTLNPRLASLDKDYFLTVNRGVITSYSLEDDVLNSTLDTLGINPYLVVPSAVLVHNEYVSTDADERLTRVLERCRVDSANAIELGELIEERNYIDDLVNDDILSNVFQYPSEQELYDYGMKHRGIIERVNDTKAKLNQLDKIIEQIQSQKSIENEKWIQTVLGVLSLLQIVSAVSDFDATRNASSLVQFIIGSVMAATATGILYLNFFRNKKVRIKKPRKNGKQRRKP